jgi:hypothetical protein
LLRRSCKTIGGASERALPPPAVVVYRFVWTLRPFIPPLVALILILVTMALVILILILILVALALVGFTPFGGQIVKGNSDVRPRIGSVTDSPRSSAV